ncbi:MAG: hypothetical protein EHM34_04745 [Nitrosopumilales archaeon]|nr:MAG: hypothetical protein EHM34_04745 [Nitrosopumilales archaeon]
MDNEEIKAFKEKLRNICTYHTDDGTSGYELSNEQFTQIEDIFLEIVNKVRSDERERIKITILNNQVGLTENTSGVMKQYVWLHDILELLK